jgi:hypothetical protein
MGLIEKKDKSVKVKNFAEVVDFLMNDAKKGQSFQQYQKKGKRKHLRLKVNTRTKVPMIRFHKQKRSQLSTLMMFLYGGSFLQYITVMC